jgi:hypothetical protein
MTSRTTLAEILAANPTLQEALARLPSLQLPSWYLGAGCITQTVWNFKCGNAVHQGILDYDLVYYDPDLSEEAEHGVREQASRLLADLRVALDVKNQARVHLWYRRRFGYDIQPYTSIHDAIDTWPTTAGAVAVRSEEDELTLYAPFGLDDLFNLVVRPNRVQITRHIYHEKVRRWLRYWPSLRVLPWEHGVGVEGSRVAEGVA